MADFLANLGSFISEIGADPNDRYRRQMIDQHQLLQDMEGRGFVGDALPSEIIAGQSPIGRFARSLGIIGPPDTRPLSASERGAYQKGQLSKEDIGYTQGQRRLKDEDRLKDAAWEDKTRAEEETEWGRRATDQAWQEQMYPYQLQHMKALASPEGKFDRGLYSEIVNATPEVMRSQSKMDDLQHEKESLFKRKYSGNKLPEETMAAIDKRLDEIREELDIEQEYYSSIKGRLLQETSGGKLVIEDSVYGNDPQARYKQLVRKYGVPGAKARINQVAQKAIGATAAKGRPLEIKIDDTGEVNQNVLSSYGARMNPYRDQDTSATTLGKAASVDDKFDLELYNRLLQPSPGSRRLINW